MTMSRRMCAGQFPYFHHGAGRFGWRLHIPLSKYNAALLWPNFTRVTVGRICDNHTYLIRVPFVLVRVYTRFLRPFADRPKTELPQKFMV